MEAGGEDYSSWNLTQVDTVEKGGLQALSSLRTPREARPEGKDVPRPSGSSACCRWPGRRGASDDDH